MARNQEYGPTADGVRAEGSGGSGTGANAGLVFDGVVYSIEVSKDEEGVTNVKFLSDPPPRSLDRVRYKWTGRLRRDPSSPAPSPESGRRSPEGRNP